MKLHVFIGSSNEARAELNQVATWIEDFGHKALPWNDPTVFVAGAYTLPSLVDVARRVQAAVFLVSEDDRVWYRGDETTQPRDNVLLEYGLFVGILGQDRVVVCRKGAPRSATDLSGLTRIENLADRPMQARTQLQVWLNSVRDRLASDNSRPLASPFQAHGKRSLFQQGTQMITNAVDRIALVARTPIPLVGTRPYGESRPHADYEKNQYERFWAVIAKARDTGKPEVCCVASVPAIAQELAKVNTTRFRDVVRQNLTALLNIAETAHSCRLLCNRYPSSYTYLVADKSFVIWFKDATGDNVWITAANEPLADALFHAVARDASPLSKDEWETQLGLA